MQDVKISSYWNDRFSLLNVNYVLQHIVLLTT